jgi:hypothetical protein
MGIRVKSSNQSPGLDTVRFTRAALLVLKIYLFQWNNFCFCHIPSRPLQHEPNMDMTMFCLLHPGQSFLKRTSTRNGACSLFL